MAIFLDEDIINNWADLLLHQDFDDKEDARKFLYMFLVEIGVMTEEEEKKRCQNCN